MTNMFTFNPNTECPTDAEFARVLEQRFEQRNGSNLMSLLSDIGGTEPVDQTEDQDQAWEDDFFASIQRKLKK